jgi:hypothetical protein
MNSYLFFEVPTMSKDFFSDIRSLFRAGSQTLIARFRNLLKPQAANHITPRRLTAKRFMAGTASNTASLPQPHSDGRSAPATQAHAAFQHRPGLGQVSDLSNVRPNIISEARCGVSNPSPTDFVTIGRWPRRTLTYSIGFITTDVDEAVGGAAIRRALDTIENAGVGLRFREVPAGGDLRFFWQPANVPGNDLRGTTIARADFPPDFSINTNSLPLPISFDDTEHTWADGAVRGAFDIETVALHEIGHTLGLLHNGIRDSVMFPSVSTNSTKRTLHPDDLRALRSLYPPLVTLDAAASWAPNRYDLFGLDDAGNVSQQFWINRWFRANLGNGFSRGSFRGQLTAASWGINRLDVFGLGPDGQVYQMWWNGRWHWSILGNRFPGTRFVGPISAASWGPNRYDIFGFDIFGRILQLWWDGRWHWSILGNGWGNGSLQLGTIAATSWGRRRLDVFTLRENGEVLQLWFDGRRWHWSNLGNRFTGTRFAGPLTAASWGTGRIDVFGLSPDGNVLQLWFDGRRWNWSNLGNAFAGGDQFVGKLTAASWGPGRLDVFGLNENGDVLQLWFDGRRWNWSNLGPMT